MDLQIIILFITIFYFLSLLELVFIIVKCYQVDFYSSTIILIKSTQIHWLSAAVSTAPLVIFSSSIPIISYDPTKAIISLLINDN